MLKKTSFLKKLPRENNHYPLKNDYYNLCAYSQVAASDPAGHGSGSDVAYLAKIRVCLGLQSLLETEQSCLLAFSRGFLLFLGLWTIPLS